MTNQGVDRVYTILLTPVQLLLEGVVLVLILLALGTAVVSLTVTNLRVVERAVNR